MDLGPARWKTRRVPKNLTSDRKPHVFVQFWVQLVRRPCLPRSLRAALLYARSFVGLLTRTYDLYELHFAASFFLFFSFSGFVFL